MLYFLLIVLIIAADRLTKLLVVHDLQFLSTKEMIPGVFHLTYCTNTGAAWGILQNGRWFFVAFTAIVLAVIVHLFLKTNNRWMKTAYSFLIGGAVGNLYDRIVTGVVVDFLDFSGIGFTAIFNIADIFVVVGTIMMAIGLLKEQKNNHGKTDGNPPTGGEQAG